VNDATIDDAAYRTRVRLEVMLDVVEAREGLTLGEVANQRVLRPLCAETNLDFVAYETGEAISKSTPRKWFLRQIAVCDSCALKQPCLERAVETKEPFGIWGGKMPSERRRR